MKEKEMKLNISIIFINNLIFYLTLAIPFINKINGEIKVDPENIYKFQIQIDSGIVYKFNCGHNTAFNPKTLVCDHKDIVIEYYKSIGIDNPPGTMPPQITTTKIAKTTEIIITKLITTVQTKRTSLINIIPSSNDKNDFINAAATSFLSNNNNNNIIGQLFKPNQLSFYSIYAAVKPIYDSLFSNNSSINEYNRFILLLLIFLSLKVNIFNF
jgi:hypothetical protein